MSISHKLEKDGTELVSTSFIKGRPVEVRIAWKTPEEAAAKLEAGKRAAEKHFSTMIVTASESKNSIRKLGTLFGREVSLGLLRGNEFTAARFSFGKVSFVADLVDGRIDWNTMRKDHRRTVHEGGKNWLFGYGGARRAVFLRFKKIV